MKLIDLTGQVFGDWTVLGVADKSGGKYRWTCRCVCGKEKPVFGTHLVRGNSKTCDPGGNHGIGEKIAGYTSWAAMIERCGRSSHVHYERYGGRGISVCDRWLKSFANFYEDMGDRPIGMSLDRIDVNGNYEPSNCRWASSKTQQNNMRSNKVVLLDGVEMTVAQHSDRTGVKYQTLYARLRKLGII